MSNYHHESDQSSYYCPRCQFGRCHPGEITYMRFYQGMVISAPNTPAYICDVCGYQEFEDAALQHLYAHFDQVETPVVNPSPIVVDPNPTSVELDLLDIPNPRPPKP